MKMFIVLLMLAHSVEINAAERAEDYAYGIPIHADSKEALQEIEIPAAVYRGVTRSDLGDLRVFNGKAMWCLMHYGRARRRAWKMLPTWACRSFHFTRRPGSRGMMPTCEWKSAVTARSSRSKAELSRRCRTNDCKVI